MDPTEPPEPQKRRTGRPKLADAPKIPWITVDKIMVFGERHVDPATGGERVRYPSLAELASRYGVSRTLMWKYAHKHNVFERRTEARLKTEARTEDKVIEKISAARANATVDVLGVLDQFILRFQTDLLEGRVKTDSAADFDRMARLREMMNGGPRESRVQVELRGGLTLEVIQSRHRAVRSQVEQLTPAIAGTVEAVLERVGADGPSANKPPEAEPPAMDDERDEDEVDQELGEPSELAAGGAP